MCIYMYILHVISCYINYVQLTFPFNVLCFCLSAWILYLKGCLKTHYYTEVHFSLIPLDKSSLPEKKTPKGVCVCVSDSFLSPPAGSIPRAVWTRQKMPSTSLQRGTASRNALFHWNSLQRGAPERLAAFWTCSDTGFSWDAPWSWCSPGTENTLWAQLCYCDFFKSLRECGAENCLILQIVRDTVPKKNPF